MNLAADDTDFGHMILVVLHVIVLRMYMMILTDRGLITDSGFDDLDRPRGIDRFGFEDFGSVAASIFGWALFSRLRHVAICYNVFGCER